VSRPEISTVVVPVSSTVDRRWVRQVTARLRDLPGVETVAVGIGQLVVSGRFDPNDVRAVVGHVGSCRPPDG
jgi:hypothetical protein